MNVRQVHVEMEELALTASVRIVVIAMPAIQETIVKLILTNARLAHVKMEELVLMPSVRIVVIAMPGIQEKIVKQVIFA